MKIAALVALATLTALAVPGTAPAATASQVAAEVDSLEAILASLQADMARLQTQLDSLKGAAPAVVGDAAAEETGAGADSAAVEPAPEPVALAEAVGVEIDAEERARYGLFRNVEGFLSAVYLKRSDGSYVVRLVYTDEAGNEVERTNKVAPVGIEFVRAKIAAAE
tara:strand:+ start:386 stop:883 length:498 start_codon:yes stop_codon:yes gene_type:complete